MQKFFLLLPILFFISVKGDAQITDTSVEKGFDSTAVLKDLMALLYAAATPISYFSVEAGVGNRLFSVHNNRLNARQSSISTLVYTPSVGYFHRSGLSLTASAYLLNDKDNGFGSTQYTLTPAYDLLGNDKFGFSISYTHYFVKDNFSAYASPIQNDIYASGSYKKTWIQPAIAFGYSEGIYKQLYLKDSTIGVTRRRLYDSATFNLKSFSMLLSASHHFEWTGMLKKNDGLLFTPSAVLNFGSYNIDVTHKTNAPLLLNRLIKKGKLPEFVTNNFQAESMGLNLDLHYSIGDFSFSPQVYLDYYLHKISSDRFTQSYNFAVAYIF